MARFTIKDLFASTTLFAAGLTALVFSLRDQGSLIGFGMWLAAGPLMGGGLMIPLQRPLVGVVIGSAISIYGLMAAFTGHN